MIFTQMEGFENKILFRFFTHPLAIIQTYIRYPKLKSFLKKKVHTNNSMDVQEIFMHKQIHWVMN